MEGTQKTVIILATIVHIAHTTDFSTDTSLVVLDCAVYCIWICHGVIIMFWHNVYMTIT